MNARRNMCHQPGEADAFIELAMPKIDELASVWMSKHPGVKAELEPPTIHNGPNARICSKGGYQCRVWRSSIPHIHPDFVIRTRRMTLTRVPITTATELTKLQSRIASTSVVQLKGVAIVSLGDAGWDAPVLAAAVARAEDILAAPHGVIETIDDNGISEAWTYEWSAIKDCEVWRMPVVTPVVVPKPVKRAKDHSDAPGLDNLFEEI